MACLTWRKAALENFLFNEYKERENLRIGSKKVGRLRVGMAQVKPS
jgi:hypothetical protein